MNSAVWLLVGRDRRARQDGQPPGGRPDRDYETLLQLFLLVLLIAIRGIRVIRGKKSGNQNIHMEDYTTNNLNQYTSGGPAGSFSYDVNGNLAATKGAPDNWTYTYDAENRLIGADNNDTNQHLSFTYDTLNRQILRFVNGTTIRSVWDGWNLIEERASQTRCDTRSIRQQIRGCYGGIHNSP